ncbi:MAG: hypothetical protein QM831_28470 [Kofleriaceae bacterium]
MKALLASLLLIAACSGDDDDGMTDGGSDPGTSAAAWTNGPTGHLYSYSGPLFDITASDGRTARQIKVDHPVGQIVAIDDSAYFSKFDTGGEGRTWKLPPTGDTVTQIADRSMTTYGKDGTNVIGEINEQEIARLDPASGAITTYTFPGDFSTGVLSCENGSLHDRTVYLVCSRFTSATGTDIGMLTFDLDTNTFGPYVLVQSPAPTLAPASNVTWTPSGVMYTLYLGDAVEGATMGQREAFKITGTTVSAGVMIPGRSSDLEEVAAVDNTLFLTEIYANTIVTFDAATMTNSATTYDIKDPRHIVAGGGQVFVGTSEQDGRIAKINPAGANDVQYKTFERLVSTQIESLAYGD